MWEVGSGNEIHMCVDGGRALRPTRLQNTTDVTASS
jgi:hypothetical protein